MPEWLPDMFCVNPWTQDTYDKLYEVFCRDIRDRDLRYLGNSVWIYRDLEDGREKIFWHLTTRRVKKTKIQPADINDALIQEHCVKTDC